MSTLKSVKVKVLTMIFAPAHAKSMLRYLITKYDLDKKYGKESFHLDRIFLRAENPITKRKNIWIEGYTVVSAMKTALGLAGQEVTMPKIYGIYFPEDSAQIVLKHITMKNGRETLLVSEVILPNSYGDLILERFPDEDMRPTYIQIGGKRKKGYGLVEIYWRM